jgi:phosphoglycolate phosphatase
MKKLLIFDFDGVVVDSLELYEETTRICFEKIGSSLAKSRKDFLDLFDDNFYEAIRIRGVDVKKFNGAIKDIIPIVDYSKVAPFNDIERVLEVLKKDNTLLVISSNSLSAINTILSRCEFKNCFEDILGADFMLSKVDKINHALERWNFTKDRTYYIGDTAGDIKEGKRSGVNTVAVTWGWHPRERFDDVNPDYIINTPSELLDI